MNITHCETNHIKDVQTTVGKRPPPQRVISSVSVWNVSNRLLNSPQELLNDVWHRTAQHLSLAGDIPSTNGFFFTNARARRLALILRATLTRYDEYTVSCLPHTTADSILYCFSIDKFWYSFGSTSSETVYDSRVAIFY